MATTYTQLAATLRTLFVTDEADTDFAQILPRCIEAAERRIYRDLLPIALLTTAQTTLVAGRSYFTVPGDFIAPRAFTLYAPVAGGRRTELPRRDSRYLAEFWPDQTQTGTPKYWSEVSFTVMQIAPTPADNYPLELLYYAMPETLSATNPVTWLARDLPDLLEYACMCWLVGYGKQTDLTWEARYQDALAKTQGQEAQRRGLQDTPPGLKPST